MCHLHTIRVRIPDNIRRILIVLLPKDTKVLVVRIFRFRAKLRNLYFRCKRTQDLKILHNDNYVDVSSSLPIFLQATAAISRLPWTTSRPRHRSARLFKKYWSSASTVSEVVQERPKVVYFGLRTPPAESLQKLSPFFEAAPQQQPRINKVKGRPVCELYKAWNIFCVKTIILLTVGLFLISWD